MARTRSKPKNFDYDICLSFAGEDRTYVSDVAKLLRMKGVRVFYDQHEKVKLWGKDLYGHLDDVYRNAARYCVLFISRHYSRKLWTNHERRSAQARAFAENSEYLLPVRFDRTKIPGLPDTIGYLDLRRLTPSQLTKLIIEKLGRPQRECYIPAIPNRLFKRLNARSGRSKLVIYSQAEAFVDAFRRMTSSERRMVLEIFVNGCPTDLPMNIHISTDLLRRISGKPVSQCLRELRQLGSVGFNVENSTEHVGHAGELIIELSFEVRRVAYEGPLTATGTINEMLISAFEHYCESCAWAAILRGDFSYLADGTAAPEQHGATRTRTK